MYVIGEPFTLTRGAEPTRTKVLGRTLPNGPARIPRRDAAWMESPERYARPAGL